MSLTSSATKFEAFDLQPGRKIAGKYEVISKLGKGWEGEVYKVREIKTDIERAAKLFFPHRNLQDKTAQIYAKKLHRLRECSLLIHYHTQEIISFRKTSISVLISEYVEGVLLSNFIQKFPGKRLDSYKAFHLLYALTCGLEEIHLMNEYHGDLHTDNIIVEKFGLDFRLKVLDLFHFKTPKRKNMQDDLVRLINVFYESMGGSRYYPGHSQVIKYICSGLKRNLILRKFRGMTQLREHLEGADWF